MNYELLYKIEREANMELAKERRYHINQCKYLKEFLDDKALEIKLLNDAKHDLDELSDVLSGENKNFVTFLKRLGLDDENISNIANGCDYDVTTTVNIRC